MQCLMSLHQTLQGNKRKTKSPARHREAYRSRLVRLGCEVMEDRVLLSAALPDYHFTAPALVAGTTQHNAPSSIGAFTKTPGGTTQRIVSNGSMQAVASAAPSFTATAVSGTQINLAWTPVAGATGYEIKINGGDYEGNCNLSSNYTSYAVTGLSPNTTYNLDVAAYNAAGTTWANSQSATTLSQNTVSPAAPSFTAKAVSATQINLAWTGVAGATGYLVDEWINSAWKQIGSLGSSSTGCAVTGLSPNTTYYFDVAACNAAGTTWANSYQSATTFPAAPSFTAKAVSATQINLAWTGVAGATGYLVDEWISGVWKQIGSLGSSSTGGAVTGLSPNTTYSFDVAAYNAAGTTWGNPQSVTTPATTTGPAPNPNALINSNWSGYVAATNFSQPQANSVTAVSGSWVVPKVTGPSSGEILTSAWVGIDGDSINGNDDVEQIGTSQDVINGQPVYQAWWEMMSPGLKQPGQDITSMTINPGDTITASVQYITSGAHAGQFYMTIVDNSRANDSFSIYASSSQYQSPLAQRSCAEWIFEAATNSSTGTISTLPNFGSVTFTNATAVINGVSGPINDASWQSQAYSIGSNGVSYAPTSVLTNSGTSFVVTYNQSAGTALQAGTNAAAGTASGAGVGTTLRSNKTIAAPVIGGSAWTGASVVSGFRTPIGQHKRPTQGFLMDPLWN